MPRDLRGQLAALQRQARPALDKLRREAGRWHSRCVEGVTDPAEIHRRQHELQSGIFHVLRCMRDWKNSHPEDDWPTADAAMAVALDELDQAIIDGPDALAAFKAKWAPGPSWQPPVPK